MARVIDKISISIMAGGRSERIAREQQNRGEEKRSRREKGRGEDDFDASPSRQPCGVITRLAEHGGGSSRPLGPLLLLPPRSFPLFNFSSLPFSLRFVTLDPSSTFLRHSSIEFSLSSFQLDHDEYDAYIRERIRRDSFIYFLE